MRQQIARDIHRLDEEVLVLDADVNVRPEDQQLLREILQDSRAVQACEDLITERTEDALDALDRAPLADDAARKALADLAIAATSRQL